MYLQSRVTRDSLSAVPHMYRVEEFLAKSQQQHQQKYKAPNHLKTLSQFTGYYRLKKFVVFFYVVVCLCFFFNTDFQILFSLKNKTKQKKSKPKNPKMKRRMLYNHFKARTE